MHTIHTNKRKQAGMIYPLILMGYLLYEQEVGALVRLRRIQILSPRPAF